MYFTLIYFILRTLWGCLNYRVLYAFFWVIPWHLNFVCLHFGTHCLFHLHRQVGAYEDGTDRVFRHIDI